MMDEVKGLSAGMRFALTRQLAARCVVLMAYVLARLLRAVAVGSDFGLGIRRSLCGGIPCAWPDVGDVRGSDGGSGCQWLSFPDIHGRGPGRVFLDRDVRQSLLLPCLLGGHDVGGSC